MKIESEVVWLTTVVIIIVNLWQYSGGYATASKVQKLLRDDQVIKKLYIEQSKLLRSRINEFMMSFSFWDEPKPEVRDCYYEMRSYVLKVSSYD